MDILIENYRGFEIKFNTEDEIFTLFSDKWDTQNVKKSFASAKKYIDDYIKENSEFKPISIIKKLGYSSKREIRLLNGMRKDGRFTYEEGGKNVQLSEYSEKDYVIYDPKLHDLLLEEIEKLSIISKKASTDLSKKEDEFTGESLKSIKEMYSK